MSRINQNVPALQAIHQLSRNQDDLTLRLERLSTGLRINRGSDDPAGLIASQSLRSELRGLAGAIENSERAINVIATADAALSETGALLLEIRGLINRSANEGALSDTELQANQLQVDSLLESINRIANTTQFNGKKLLNGQLGYTISSQTTTEIARLQVFGARVPNNGSVSVTLQVTQSAQTASLFIPLGGGSGLSASGNLAQGNNVTIEIQGSQGTEIFGFTGSTTTATIATAINSFTDLTGIAASASSGGLTFSSTGFGSNEFVSVKAISGTFTVNAGDQGDTRDAGRDAGVLVNGQLATVDGLIASIRTNGLDFVADLTQSFGTALGSSTFGITGGGALFQIGPDVNADGLVSIGIPTISTSNLGNSVDGFLNSIGTGGSASLVGGNFVTAEGIIKSAIEQVSVLSGRLGGFQANQLETNINSRRVAFENVTAAESAIRDTDYSVEVANLTRAQILVQSTTQILGLANQLPQNVLLLLR
ncbi:MAG: flagellin [Planctomycetota bacterium]|nr:flagellin [Planctomycetota bacterium]